MSTPYVALLRGINVGGNNMISMANLRAAFEKMGFKNVKTILATGNILFDAEKSDTKALETKIAAQLQTNLKKTIHVIVRPKESITALIASDPFAGIKVTPETRLYVTFLLEKPGKVLESLPKLPFYPTPYFTILMVTDTEICSVLVLSPTSRSVDSMAYLEKTFGKGVTTRNWNTVLKLVKS